MRWFGGYSSGEEGDKTERAGRVKEEGSTESKVGLLRRFEFFQVETADEK